jgi:hypothetical protein
MVSSPLLASSHSPGDHTTLPITSPSSKPSPPLSSFPAEIKSSQQWQAKIYRLEDQEDAERRGKQARRNRREYRAERRPNTGERRQFGTNGGGAWELWEEWDGEDEGEDDDDGVVGRDW